MGNLMKRRTVRSLPLLTLTMACGSLVASAVGDGSNDAVQIARPGDNSLVSRDTPNTNGNSHASALTPPILASDPTLPRVVLSATHRKTCRLSVGDKVAGVSALGLDGQAVDLRDELSDQLTVLIFWSERSITGYEQFRRIPVEILAKFAPHRVKVIAVNAGGTVAETKRLTGNASKIIVSLADPDQSVLGKFSSAPPPQTYVLDKAGNILWLDIEYSQSTYRSLDNALTYFLQQNAKASP